MKTNYIITATLFLFLLFCSHSRTAAQQYNYANYVSPSTRTINTSLAVGSTAGNYLVDHRGAFVYSIPVYVSPGTAGLQPSVSIVYNSRIADGLLGKGFGLAGLSQIERVGQNHYNDGKATGVDLSYNDRFVLDSNRLILTSGSYGANGSEYRTEIETFARIRAYGTSGNGPERFVVETKDGRTLDYGNTADSRVEAQGTSTAHMWRLNRVTDPNGNYINYIYNEVAGESYLARIEYTGNTVTGLSPYNKVVFSYEERSDKSSKYVGGSKIPQTRLLTSVKMIIEGEVVVREYLFKYVLDNYSYLNQVVEKGLSGIEHNATLFGFGPKNSTPSDLSSSFDNDQQSVFYHGDFNGDGRRDFIVVPKYPNFSSTVYWKLYLASADGHNFTFANQGTINQYFKRFIISDVNGDGIDDAYMEEYQYTYQLVNPHPCDENPPDAIVASTTTGKVTGTNQIDLLLPPPADTCWDVYYVNQTRYLYYSSSGSQISRGGSSFDFVYNEPPNITMYPADINGDGKNEYLFIDGAGYFYDVKGVPIDGSLPSFQYGGLMKIVDFNGDGREDIMATYPTYTRVWTYDSDSENFTTLYNSSFPIASARIFTGDFNGDGKTDILSYSSGWTLRFSTGTGFVTSSNTPGLTATDPGASAADNNIYIADFNGDGLDDIMEVYKSSSSYVVFKTFYSIGDGQFYSEQSSYQKSTIHRDYFSFADFNGDGKDDLFYYDYNNYTNPVEVYFFRKDEKSNLIHEIANGMNLKTLISYKRLNEGSEVYTRGTGAAYPVNDVNGALYVAENVNTSNGQSGYSALKYTYEGGKKHLQGKGFIGFLKTIQSNLDRNNQVAKTYAYNPDYFNLSLQKETFRIFADSAAKSETTYTNHVTHLGNKRIFPFTSQASSWSNITGEGGSTYYTYDSYGNILTMLREYGSDQYIDAKDSVSFDYGSYGNYGIDNRVERVYKHTKYTGEDPLVRITQQSYDSRGNVVQVKENPQTSAEVTTTSSINYYGLPYQVVVSASGVSSKTSTYEYDNRFRYITGVTNPAGQSSSVLYDPATGQPLESTSIDNQTTEYAYDGFGRVTYVDAPGSLDQAIIYSWHLSATSAYAVTTSTPGVPDKSTFFDVHGREVGSNIEDYFPVEKTYYPSGLLKTVSYPYTGGKTMKTEYFYDEYGRVVIEDNNGIETYYSHNMLETHIYFPGGQEKEVYRNWTGQVNSIVENNHLSTGSTSVDYSFCGSGQVKEITSAGIAVSFGYDQFGRRTSVTNPNAGTTTFAYNALGQLTSQTDARNNTTEFAYDILGRPLEIETTEGVTSYSYITSGNGKGKLGSVTGPGGVGYSYQYNSLGNVNEASMTISGDQSFSQSIAYDTLGRVVEVTMPGDFVLKYSYNYMGLLSAIKLGDNTPVWELTGFNMVGQPLSFLHGSTLSTTFQYDSLAFLTKKTTGSLEQNYIFDHLTGNLLSRGRGTLSETFQYDHLDRLTSSQVNGLSALSLTYSGSGNIASKADLGAYTYNQVKVNAVDNIVGDTLATVPSFQQLVSYTSFNKAHTIEDESNGYDYQIIYGPDNQRVKSILSDSLGWERTRYYFGSYEKDSTSSGVKHTWYINSPYGLVAVYVKENTTETLYYAETDHLGSLVALRNTNGTVVESYSYDPWGRRRNPSNWSYSNVPEPVITNRGYTGHEHLDKFNLIDMNGRVYDPVTAGFLSPDIVVQAIDDSRAYNSYSYCYNNPLKAVDPSGYVMMMLPEYDGYSVASTNRALSQIEMRKSGEYSQIDIWRMEDGSWDPLMDEPESKRYWDYMQSGASSDENSEWGQDYLVFTGARESKRKRVDGTLTWFKKTWYGPVIVASWSANSGSKTYLSIPQGVWSLQNWRLRYEDSFTLNEVGFSIDITPDPQHGRKWLRIHPDGGPSGTEGCIGLMGNTADLQRFSDMMRTFLSKNGTMRLYVQYGLPIFQIYP